MLQNNIQQGFPAYLREASDKEHSHTSREPKVNFVHLPHDRLWVWRNLLGCKLLFNITRTMNNSTFFVPTDEFLVFAWTIRCGNMEKYIIISIRQLWEHKCCKGLPLISYQQFPKTFSKLVFICNCFWLFKYLRSWCNIKREADFLCERNSSNISWPTCRWSKNHE